MKTIVYASNTGFTKEYAEMLSEKTGLPLCSLEEAKKTLKKSAEIIYCSWFMAGSVVGYKKLKKKYDIKAVCAVGLCETGTLIEKTRKDNKIPENTELFTLQGGYAPDRLKGIYKKMMAMVSKMLIKQINDFETKTESDLKMLETLEKGGSYVCEENLSAVLEWYEKAGR